MYEWNLILKKFRTDNEKGGRETRERIELPYQESIRILAEN